MKHAFAKKCAAQRNAEQTTCKFAVRPRFNTMGKALFMKVDIEGTETLADPCRLSRGRARLNHARKIIIDPDIEKISANCFGEAS